MNGSDKISRRRFVAVTAAVSAAALLARSDAAQPSAAASDDLLDRLDLDRPELAAVKSAYATGDVGAAGAALARHFRQRKTPKWWFDPAAPPKGITEGDPARADALLAHTVEVIGIPHTFGPVIDWRFNPTTQPASPNPRNHEWTWQFNRHVHWITLGQAYSTTGDARYGRELAAQIKQWIDANPPPAEADQKPFSRWRTIEAGIRMIWAWPNAYHHLLASADVFPDDVLLVMVKGFGDHAAYLDAHQTTGNWLVMEADGQFHAATLFPEFKDARKWRDNALARLRHELDTQFYPDGVQVELTPGYHNVTLLNYVTPLRFARLNDVPLPAGFVEGLERVYAMNLWAMSPDRDVPHLNDSWPVNVPAQLADGLNFFPKREDWRYVATDAKEGKPPDHASHLFPYAGWAVMRSGWERDATYLLMEAGPFGYGHQHEDKLSFVLHAYGSRLVFDAGSYAYDASDMRKYVTSARGHNVVHVDGLEQHRKGMPKESYIAKSPAAMTWETSKDYDYAVGTFGRLPEEGWGRERKRHVVHTRRVLFVKPDYWIVLDTLAPADDAEHTYQSTFHLDAPDAAVEVDPKRVITLRPADSANLTIFSLAAEGLTVEIVKGQEKPVLQGWLPKAHGLTGATPMPTACYTFRGTGERHLLYVFAPSRPGQLCPVGRVSTGTGSAPGTLDADVHLTAGGVHQFRMSADRVELKAGSGRTSFTSRAGR